VIGPIAAILAILLIGFFLLRRKRQKKQRLLGEEAERRDKPLLADTELPRRELADKDIKELGSESQREELEGKIAAHELGPHHEPAELGRATVEPSDRSTIVQSSVETETARNLSQG
jgi:hypothetical protein